MTPCRPNCFCCVAGGLPTCPISANWIRSLAVLVRTQRHGVSWDRLFPTGTEIPWGCYCCPGTPPASCVLEPGTMSPLLSRGLRPHRTSTTHASGPRTAQGRAGSLLTLRSLPRLARARGSSLFSGSKAEGCGALGPLRGTEGPGASWKLSWPSVQPSQQLGKGRQALLFLVVHTCSSLGEQRSRKPFLEK